MKNRTLAVLWLLLGIFAHGGVLAAPLALDPSRVPEPLKSWADWARWNETHGLESVPGNYNDPKKTVPLWPSTLELVADQTGGKFSFQVEAYAQTWAMLPGSRDIWPVRVSVDGDEAPVLEHAGAPAVLLPPGKHRIAGTLPWERLPRTLQIPSQTGVLMMILNGQEVPGVTWNAEGVLWLERRPSEPDGSRDFAELKIYRVLEDGAPMWLRTEMELTVSGKSRELELGGVLPSGWLLASTAGPVPMAVDEAGRLKVQARAGKWILHAEAFSLQAAREFRFAPDVTPAVAQELVAFKAVPGFRSLELTGVPSVDVSQTTFPQRWRDLPLYRWDTKNAFQIEERMRGMGRQQIPGLNITRRLWLDENGRGLTFRDQISGTQQTLWRLDSAPGQQLGSVRSGEEGQLVTKNPATGALGVEVRFRNLALEATGRIENARTLPASGWNTTAAAAKVTLHLPPGWRLLALFGADYVRGDWLTAWTLLDLFVVLVFSMGVGRVFGRPVGALAFGALVLSYREPEAPRYAWLFLLAALALVRVVRDGWARHLVRLLKGAAVLSLLLTLVPFVETQIQQALHPQLEKPDQRGAYRSFPEESALSLAARDQAEPGVDKDAAENAARSNSTSSLYVAKGSQRKLQLFQDTGARIQTGPPVPDWKWREASYGWNGPVAPSQQVRLILVPTGLVRVLTVLRVGLLLALCSLLLNVGELRRRWWARAGAAVWMFCGLAPHSQAAEPPPAIPAMADAFPSAQMLQLLRDRMAPVSDAFPHAADIPLAALEIQKGRITLKAEIHVATRTAVPLPGKLPVWSPTRVVVDGLPQAAMRREDGFLWVVLEAGVHRLRVEGDLGGAAEWEWAFRLKPRRVEIDAPEWLVSGVRANGVPEEQVFFRAKEAKSTAVGGYEQQPLRTALRVDRRLVLGFNWQIHTTVQRLSQEGRAVSTRIPLLAGEHVISAGPVTAEGAVEVRLGAGEKAVGWVSEIPVSASIELTSRDTDTWVEQWTLEASPAWNVTLEGLPPVYAAQASELVPRWNPWPGEAVRLKVSRAEAQTGETITVGSVHSETSVGLRQRTQRLSLGVRSSLGEDFILRLPAEVEVRSVKLDGKDLPVRMEAGQAGAGRLQIPLHPGDQSVAVEWESTQPLLTPVMVAPVALPVPCANIQTIVRVPDGRWILWTHGPLRGPAVRFWSILVFSIVAGAALGRLRGSPLCTRDWVLLCIGLTQASLLGAFAMVGWLLGLAWRERQPYAAVRPWLYNLLQTGLVLWTLAALSILASAVVKGLLGHPEMFITGNESTRLVLKWYQAQSDGVLPQPGCLQVSLWWYRLAMLLWALWLAGAVLGWLKRGWEAFSSGGPVRSGNPKPPPPLPPLQGAGPAPGPGADVT
jgi:hypothetical protein